MPETEVTIFCDESGASPLIAWLDELPATVQDKCIVRIERLKEMGHELRRPEADTLKNGIYELRTAFQRVQYRILYFFAGRLHAVLTHGLIKESRVPEKEIEFAMACRDQYGQEPQKHTFGG